MENIYVYWLVVSIIMFVTFILFGVKICSRPLGILIDAQNRMSLSRLQIVLWSWLLISAFFSIALAWRTLNIVMAPEIWALMGISIASTTGAVIIKGTKAGQQADKPKLAARLNQLNPKIDPSNTQLTQRLVQLQNSQNNLPEPVLQQNISVKDAKLANIIQGEEVTDYDHIDITKVQNLFFTVAMVIGYGCMLWSSSLNLTKDGIIFPSLSSSMVTLLGISHAGYLVSKAAPKTPTM
jgi:hypothetical protein